MRIALIKGPSQYGAIRLQTDQMRAAFERAGAETYLIELLAPEFRAQVEAAGKAGIDLLYSPTVGWPARVGASHLADLFGCPYVALSIDHPAYLLDEIDRVPENTILLTLDETHQDYLAQVFPAGRFRAMPLVPPGGSCMEPTEPAEADAFCAAREIPVLFTGTLRFTGATDWEEAGGPVKRVLDDAAEACLAADLLPPHEAILAAAERSGLVSEDKRTAFLRQWTASLNEHIHSKRRMQAMKRLAEAGIPVHVWGKNWQKRLYRFKSFVYGGDGTSEETLALMKRARIVLNTNTNFVGGGHERVFAAMRAGAAVVSDCSTYYERVFEDGVSIALYRWTALRALPELIRGLLDDPERLSRIANAGLARAETRHSWDARAAEILALAKEYGIRKAA